MEIENVMILCSNWSEEQKSVAVHRAIEKVGHAKEESVGSGAFSAANSRTGIDLHAAYFFEGGLLAVSQHDSFEEAKSFAIEFGAYTTGRSCEEIESQGVLTKSGYNPELN